MKYSVAAIQYLTIEADSEDEAYEKAREMMYRQYRWIPDTIDVEPEDDEPEDDE